MTHDFISHITATALESCSFPGSRVSYTSLLRQGPDMLKEVVSWNKRIKFIWAETCKLEFLFQHLSVTNHELCRSKPFLLSIFSSWVYIIHSQSNTKTWLLFIKEMWWNLRKASVESGWFFLQNMVDFYDLLDFNNLALFLQDFRC